MSYNIQAGTSTNGYHDYVRHSWKHILPNSERINNLDNISSLLKNYDIVGLQEADGGSLRSGFMNQTRYLAEQAEFDYWTYQRNRKVSKIALVSNGLLSRFQPETVEDHRLPGKIPGRGLLVARYGTDRFSLVVAIMHLALGRRARANQLDYVAEKLSGDDCLVVMGDANCSLSSAEMQRFCGSLNLQASQSELHTFPSWHPERGLDHILVSPGLNPQNYKVVDVPHSDHLPVSVEIQVPAECIIDEC